MDTAPAGMTPLGQLGEFGLIDRLTTSFSPRHQHILKGVGDDAAVVQIGNGRVLVSTTDLLLEGVHFDLAYAPLRHLGYKSVMVNLSDVFAMNAIPYGILVSVAASNRFPVEALEELYEGIKAACDRFQIDLMGGDTSSSKQGLVISVTAMGEANENEVVYRSGAQPNDLICVSGDVGAAYAGFLILDREKQVYLKDPNMQPDLSDYDYVAGRQLKPEARGDIIQKFRELGIQPTSMIDVSDGIASELHHICRGSKTGATIYSNKLPIDYQAVSVAEEFKISPVTFALNGGEDYELLFTIPLSEFEKIQGNDQLHVIGKITDEPMSINIVLDDGSVAEVEAQGWQHFKQTE
ncbi:MAG: thiamine-phosphate kinase [Bacteroidota bacterium]